MAGEGSRAHWRPKGGGVLPVDMSISADDKGCL